MSVVQRHLILVVCVLAGAPATLAAPSDIEDRSAGSEAQTVTACLDPQVLANNARALQKMAPAVKAERPEVVHIQVDAIPKPTNHVFVSCTGK